MSAPFPYRDPALPIEERVQDLLSRMTLPEKISQMNHISPGIERLGVPEYNWWNEALHGVARAGRATVFPQAIGMAATFDPSLIHRVASAVADEVRAKHHAAIRAGNRGQYRGLTFWTPNVNIFRDPRWGRGQETWGEDPHLTAVMGSAFVRGLQGDHPERLKAAACAKHYAVHSGPEAERHSFDAVVSKQDLYDTYLPAFHALVKVGVEAVMGAYNRTLGEPCCGSDFLIRQVLRRDWGFQGHYVSDCWAIQDFHLHHRVTRDAAESAALAVRMGCDLSCGCAYLDLNEAVERGLVTEAEIDACLERLIRAKLRLGLFDPPEADPFASIPEEVIGCDAHRSLARETAVRSVVLLKNHGTLPLATGANAPKRILVVGPNALDQNVLLGNYFGIHDRLVSIAEGIVGAVGEGTTVEYRLGSQVETPNANPIDWITGDAGAVDVVIAVVGFAPLMEGEEGEAIASRCQGDRDRIELPEAQLKLLQLLHRSGTPVVLVVTGGSAIAMPEAHEMAAAVLWVGYPGQEGGNAVADILFGKVAPGGKLPVSFPYRTEDLPPFEDYTMDGRTYRYGQKEPLYPFGFGLSTTRFTYRLVSASRERVEVAVANVGNRPGREVAQLYVAHLDAPFRVPECALKGFVTLDLGPGEVRNIAFELNEEHLSVVDPDGNRVVPEGRVRIWVGGSSPGPRSQALGAPEPAEALLN